MWVTASFTPEFKKNYGQDVFLALEDLGSALIPGTLAEALGALFTLERTTDDSQSASKLVHVLQSSTALFIDNNNNNGFV